MSLDQFVNAVQTYSSQANYAELCEHLNKSQEILQRNPGQLDGVLESLDMSQHSLGYLAVLVAKLGQDTTNTWQQILALCDNFVSVCNNDQIRWSESTGRAILITLVLYQVQPQQSV